MSPLVLSTYTLSTCLGRGVRDHVQALRTGRSGLKPCDFETVHLPTWIAEVEDVDAIALPPHLAEYDCRNNRLALLGLETDGFADRVRDAVQRHGAQRVGVFIGTSTSGILETELAYRQRDDATGALPQSLSYRGSHCPFSVTDFARHYLGIEGPALTVSTACSSSAKVFAAAARQIALGLIDVAVVGGVDSLCLTTLYGFSSLQLTSGQPARPYDQNRDGISVGEGAAFALLERPGSDHPSIAVHLLGVGESSDAHHMSAPHPEGLGALLAMQAALRSAGLAPQAIDYINLHGTATYANDAAEGKAVAQLFGGAVPCSSTKGATGHTLGAAGAVEALICALALEHGWLPGSPGTRMLDPAIALDYRIEGSAAPLVHALSNSFGFGGSNCALVLGLRS
ncbi:beta-ketoacyl-[acyl-carrier-protein] synthase II [Melaminivora suipulveris]|uniref:Beta-ketoacyl-[acyl-carrier-protein] synthase II n=1 Tax=Melaminivora suipulveris TaxID=2109913 RepID=A0A2R3QBY2_9BURK|nr:beta-ketoacyl-[acyl-carrier-protein] synthase family protein [Melaminivora suipulveris]AVO49305.1 beta-ketoacyl-[acyl-carrier-protein] synthase II [Melaminivora suipulveris]